MFGTATGEATISEVRAAMACFVRSFDASVLSAADAVIVVDEAARIEKMAATLKALAAARAAETDLLQRDGDASPAHALARRTGTSVTKAADAIRTARRLASQPGLDAAARRGDVSAEQASAISDAVAADPRSESRLVGSARSSSLQHLRDECERTKAAADADAEERHRRIHAARFARRRSCADGSGEITYRSTRDEIAEVWAIIGGFANQAFDRARRAGGRESGEAYAADGVLAMARAAGNAARATSSAPDHDDDRSTGRGEGADSAGAADHAASGGGGAAAGGATAGGGDRTPVGDGGEVSGAGDGALGGDGALPGLEHDPPSRLASRPVAPASGSPPAARSPVPTRVVVRIDWTALVRGRVAGEEVCEITGVGPVAVSAVRAMIASGDPFLAAVVTKGVDVASVAHLGRRPTAHQATALDWLSTTCQVLGCDMVARLETDHRIDWADSHVTVLGWLERMCECHHDKKTYGGWALVAGGGKRALVAPDDPRHPRHQAQQGGGDPNQRYQDPVASEAPA